MQALINPSRISAQTPWEKLACLLLISGTLLYYWTVFFHHALDAGQADDFVDALWFFEIFRVQESWLGKLAVIALPNHEHITIFNHLVYLAHYALFKQINFFHYMLLGHLMVLACCLLLAEWMQKFVGWWFALALTIVFFLNLFYWHASFWAMTALSNQAVVLFALLAARSFAFNPDAIAKPLLWALLAVTTQFNGLLVLPALICSGFIVKKIDRSQKNWLQLLIWSGAFFITTAAYISYENPFATDHLWRYVIYTDPQNLKDYIKPFSANHLPDIANTWNAPLTLLSMTGASVFNLTQWLPASLCGVVLLCLLWATSVRSPAIPDRFWWAMLFFVAASITLVAVGRGVAFGPEAGLLYRYRMYSFLALILLAGSAAYRKASRATVWTMLLVGLLVQVCSQHVLNDINRERENVKVSHYNWLVDGGMGRSQMPFYPHNQDLRLFNAYQSGYYNPYQAIDTKHKPAAIAKVSDQNCTQSASSIERHTVNAWSKKARALAVEITIEIEASANPVQLLFCDNAGAYQLTLDERNINRDTGKYEPFLVLKKQLPPSQYRVLLQQDHGSYTPLGNIAFP